MTMTLDQLKQRPPIFAGTALTIESIQAARQWYNENAQKCIDDAISGKTRVNDLESYIEFRQRSIKDLERDDVSISFALLQKAHYIQTGECVALLP